MPDLYRDLILDHWKNPRNFGKFKNPAIDVEESNPLCGDEIRLQLQIEKGKITDVRFSGKGCALSQAGASILTERLKGKTLAAAKKLKESKYLEITGMKPNPTRLKCALLSFVALKKSLK